MAFNFRRSVKLAPGIRVNVSKSGTSLSVGKADSTLNLSKRGARATVGIPGTGLSYASTSSAMKSSPGEVLDKIANRTSKLSELFNTNSERTVKAAEAWNKAMAAFEGGRGPTESKFRTLTKRSGIFRAALERSELAITKQAAELEAILEYLTSMKFGLFAGASKEMRDDMLSYCKAYQESLDRYKAQIHLGLENQQAELADAERLVL